MIGMMDIQQYYAPVCDLDDGFAGKIVKVLMLWLCLVCGMVFGWYVRVEDGDDEEEYEDDLANPGQTHAHTCGVFQGRPNVGTIME